MASRTVGLLSHPVCLAHDTGSGHPESAARLEAIAAHLDATGLAADLVTHEAPVAPAAALESVHPRAYLERVADAFAAGRSFVDSPDATGSAATWEATCRAAGAGLEAVDRVVAGDWDAAFCAVRPPGHHAEEGLSMGFCFVNAVAVAARHAQKTHGLERVAIVDWDVHHGNGTQHLFEEDPTVFYASLHQHPHYPGTGAASERGRSAGEGTTLNLPLPSGTDDATWLAAFEGHVLPAVEAFDPELVLISAGFDAHAADPLSGTRLTDGAYARMTEGLGDVADRCAAGRLVSLLEGGYELDALARSVHEHVRVLRDR